MAEDKIPTAKRRPVHDRLGVGQELVNHSVSLAKPLKRLQQPRTLLSVRQVSPQKNRRDAAATEDRNQIPSTSVYTEASS